MELIKSHPELLTNCTVQNVGCKKNIGENGKLRKWSRGHQFIVRSGGHIDDWQPLYKCVSHKLCEAICMCIHLIFYINEVKQSVL